MNEKDKKLIKQAEKVRFPDWSDVGVLAKQAESDEAKKELLSIESRLYHTEEYFADCQ